MYAIDRLVRAGMDAETAFDAVFGYYQRKDGPGLERFICEVERGQKVGPEDG